jgi:xylulokinase
MRGDGRIIGVAQKPYDVLRPQTGFAEQAIDTLWQAACVTLKQLGAEHPQDMARVKCVGYSGQMHGLVLLDARHKPLRNAIIWEDQRSVREIDEILAAMPPEEFCGVTRNRLSTGYLVTSLLWVRRHEPEVFERASVLMLPKDYVRYRMCGEIGSDMSDASSTLIFNTARREWAWDIIDKMRLPRSLFPACRESYQIAGQVTPEAAALTGLQAGTPVVFGGGDTLMHEGGTCLIDESRPWVANIGTSCQVTCAMNAPNFDRDFRTNTFCHVKENLWMLMSCNLCGGAAMKWLSDMVYGGLSLDEINRLVVQAPPGSDGLIFLPYLNGARCPDNDPKARGMYFGLTLSHGKAHMVRATMEGIVYSLKNSFNILESIVHQTPRYVIAAGGGARGRLFLQMEADAFNRPVYTTVEAEQSCIGAALTAAIGVGYYSSYAEACDSVIRFNDEVVEPIPANVEKCNEYFAIYRELYEHNKDLFAKYHM